MFRKLPTRIPLLSECNGRFTTMLRRCLPILRPRQTFPRNSITVPNSWLRIVVVNVIISLSYSGLFQAFLILAIDDCTMATTAKMHGRILSAVFAVFDLKSWSFWSCIQLNFSGPVRIAMMTDISAPHYLSGNPIFPIFGNIVVKEQFFG